MGLIDRAKNICISPKSEWPVIAAEPSSTAGLLTGYVAPLALIAPLAAFIGGSLVGHTLPFIGTYRTPLLAGAAIAILTYLMTFVGVFVLSLIINALATSFGGEKNSQQALKVAVYSFTPGWIAGVLQVLPLLGLLAILAALYGLYLLYLGLPRLMNCPEDKSVGYTVVVVICAIVIWIVIGTIAAAVGGMGMMAAGGMHGMMRDRSGAAVQFDKSSPAGKLEEFGRKIELAGKKMEAAGKKDDPAAQAAAAGEVLGTLLGGGRKVDPVAVEELKAIVPETLLGLAKKSSRAERGGALGISISKAEALYGEAPKTIELEVTDTGGASGMVAFAGWAGIQGEKEDENRIERTRRDGGRLVHEKVSKTGGSNEFGVVLGERFIVTAKGRGVTLAELKTAVSSLDLARLESMKDLGVAK
jgi:hypothetical protein